jgi:hypothetical protein
MFREPFVGAAPQVLQKYWEAQEIKKRIGKVPFTTTTDTTPVLACSLQAIYVYSTQPTMFCFNLCNVLLQIELVYISIPIFRLSFLLATVIKACGRLDGCRSVDCTEWIFGCKEEGQKPSRKIMVFMFISCPSSM